MPLRVEAKIILSYTNVIQGSPTSPTFMLITVTNENIAYFRKSISENCLIIVNNCVGAFSLKQIKCQQTEY